MDTVSEISEPPPSPSIPPYQRLTKALQTDPRCAHEVSLGRRVGLYRFCGDIGRGNFSKVKLAVHQLTRDKVAIKVVDRGGLDARALRMLSREVATLECVHHPNILRLFEVIETLGRVYLVTEWVRGGELYSHITHGGPLREVHAAPLYKQLLLAVKHMHSLGFVHRDIKAENVLLVSESQLKLADFGFSTELINGHEQKLDTFCGSPPYAAPELFSDDHYIGGPVDVWALGVLLYFMVVGNMPFRAPTVPALRTAVLKGDYTVPGHLSLPCIRLIQRILLHLPSRRPSIDEILSSQWITQPNLSIELMTEQINQYQKTTAKKTTSYWFRSKTRRIGKTYSLRERYLEIANKGPINFNTKRNDGVLVNSFLHPIDITITNNDQLITEQQHQQQQSSIKRSSCLCGTLKKKISPIDIEKVNEYEQPRKGEQQITMEFPITYKNYDEEKGQFVMIPTDTDDLCKLNPLEVEAREYLEKLGVSSDMLRASIQNGPRNELIGAYRIIINRLQKQAWLVKKQAEAAFQEPQKTTKRSRTCTIL